MLIIHPCSPRAIDQALDQLGILIALRQATETGRSLLHPQPESLH